ncbi:sugar-binding transcriptional regulator [Bacillus sp. 1P06AnD]|uniref:sugar-binding transcriptional regulator n=1 Tax=Bacillus sp. 1P06AnD TaxID=3132208 RepID=UPI0039A03162
MAEDLINDNNLMKAAWFYYKENMNQSEIAEQLGMSRTKVVRLLEKARTEGIVQIHIKRLEGNCLNVEQEIINQFNLKNAFIIPTPVHDEGLVDSLAKAAAQFLQSRLQPNDLIGIGWGRTVAQTIDRLDIRWDQITSVVTLTGGIHFYLQNRQGQDGRMEKFNEIHVIPAPMLASSTELAEIFLKEPAIKQILDFIHLSAYSLVGIGGVYSDATIIQEESLSLNELAYIKKQEAAGDILGQFFNAEGELLDLPHHHRYIGISLDKLKETQHVIGVAGGQNKVEAIYGALKGGYIHTLVTDEQTALALLGREGDQ